MVSLTRVHQLRLQIDQRIDEHLAAFDDERPFKEISYTVSQDKELMEWYAEVEVLTDAEAEITNFLLACRHCS